MVYNEQTEAPAPDMDKICRRFYFDGFLFGFYSGFASCGLIAAAILFYLWI